MPERLHISSLLLRADPERIDTVLAEIAAISGAEAAVTEPNGKIIVTLETEGEDEIVENLNRLSLIDGVASAGLVYHQTETETDADIPA